MASYVEYMGGESRAHPGEHIHYMKSVVDGVELYAEADPDKYGEIELYNVLKDDILRQADAANISTNDLEFSVED